MNTTQISPSVDSHTEEPLWQELTEQEQEKICGGGYWTKWKNRTTWKDSFMGRARFTRWWVDNKQCRPQTQITIRNGLFPIKRTYWGL